MTAPHLELEIDPTYPVVRFQRVVQAECARVFDAWTTPAALLQWWGPADLPLVECTVDLRVGGSYRFVHRAADGSRHVFVGRYQRIERPTLLSYTSRFEPWPESAVDTVTFEDRGGRTLISCSSRHPTFESRDRWVTGGMRRGLTAAQRRLDDYLKALTDRLEKEEQ
jgi:uncharacterized protein YndB with AHSA1/START domain